mgnify:CR=1 FL=1
MNYKTGSYNPQLINMSQINDLESIRIITFRNGNQLMSNFNLKIDFNHFGVAFTS